jgi:hypothetical protein
MTLSIPASRISAVTPSVISAGGSPFSLNGLVLTTSTRVPVGLVMSFGSAALVNAYFGPTSREATVAAIYFAGFDGSTIKPGAVLFTQYPTAAVAAYLRGGSVAGLTLAQLQAVAGVLAVTINGALQTSSAINLSAATSFSNAAQLINFALGATGATVASVTGAIATTTLTVSAVASGTLGVGTVLAGTSVTAGTYITALGTGTGGAGTYTVSVSQTTASTTITGTAPVVSYDSIAGAFVATSGTTGPASTITVGSGSIAAGLALTTATGAVLSQGAAIATPAAFMAGVIVQTQNWATFMTAFEPNTADKVSFATWNGQQNNRFAYVGFDTDITVTQPNPTASFGFQIIANGVGGTFLLYEPSDLTQAAMVLGFAASIDFARKNGRVDLAFLSQSGMPVGVNNDGIAQQLIANGYNFYGAYGTATANFNFLYPGTVTGPFAWLDSYLNQIQMNASLQQALMILRTQVKSIPYNDAGYGLIRQALADPINAALNFGSIRTGVPLSALQAAEVNAAAGVAIDGYLSTRGWYLQILPASAGTRVARGSPTMTFWYMDGQDIQSLNLGSIEVQ